MEKNAERIFVTGGSGSGKSCFTIKMIKNHKRVIVFDVLDEYGELRGFKIARTLKELKNIMVKNYIKGFKVSFVPKSGAEVKELHLLSQFLLRVQQPYKKGFSEMAITLVVEEMNTSYPVNSIKQEFFAFGEICSRGRHSGISVIGVSQRIAEVNTRFRGNCNWVVFFRTTNHTDVKTICNIISPDYKKEIPNLKTHHYLKFKDGKISHGKNCI